MDIVSYSYLGFQCRDPMKNFCERPSNQEKLMLIYLETIYWSSIVKLVWQNNSENDNDVKMHQVMHKSVC
jgi:hypothetical protein